MSIVNSDDFGSLIAFASQLIFMIHDNLFPSHDFLNSIGINKRCVKKSKAGNCLRPRAHILKINDALWVNNGVTSLVSFDHNYGHRELITFPIDPMVFDSLLCISQ